MHVDLTELIETRPGVRSGKPCFVGTRIAVHDVLDYLASGMTADEIRVEYPDLTHAQIYAALAYYHDHKDEIEALQILYSRPARAPLKFEDIKTLAETLHAPPRLWTESQL